MGKSRRNRGGAGHRRDPATKPIKPPSDPELAALREAKILPIIRDLQTSDPKSHSAGASAVSSIIKDANCRKLLLREQIVHTVLTQTLADRALESHAAGWSILQVLAQEEDSDFCVHLFRLDVLTSLEFASKMVTEKLLSNNSIFSKSPKAEQASVLSITSSLVYLVTAMAESRDEILEKVANNHAITKLVFVLISYVSQGEDDGVTNLRTDGLACLMILSEDNPELSEKIANSKDNGCGQRLTALKNEVNGEGVLACAILHNIFAALRDSKKYSQVSNADDTSVIPTLTKAIAGYAPGHPAMTNRDGWSSPLGYQGLALETIAAIGTDLTSQLGGGSSEHKKQAASGAAGDEDMGDVDGVPSDDEDVEAAADAEGDDDDEMEEDEMDDDEMEADMHMVTGADDDADVGADGIDDLPVLKSLLQTTLPEVIRIASLPATSDETMRLQSHALSALNNIAWSVSLLDFSTDHNAGIQKAWAPIGHTIWKRVIAPILSSDTADVGLATQVTSIAWAVARSLQGKTPLQTSEHRKFISLYQATKGSGAATQDPDDPFQALGVKCVGVLGQLALDPAPMELNREISTFLVTLLEGLPETPAADAVEALSQIFDIYGNEDYAYDKEVFWKDGFLKHLENVLPKARAMAKGVDRKTQAELRSRAHDAVVNLDRFLAYKRKHKP